MSGKIASEGKTIKESAIRWIFAETRQADRERFEAKKAQRKAASPRALRTAPPAMTTTTTRSPVGRRYRPPLRDGRRRYPRQPPPRGGEALTPVPEPEGPFVPATTRSDPGGEPEDELRSGRTSRRRLRFRGPASSMSGGRGYFGNPKADGGSRTRSARTPILAGTPRSPRAFFLCCAIVKTLLRLARGIG